MFDVDGTQLTSDDTGVANHLMQSSMGDREALSEVSGLLVLQESGDCAFFEVVINCAFVFRTRSKMAPRITTSRRATITKGKSFSLMSSSCNTLLCV